MVKNIDIVAIGGGSLPHSLLKLTQKLLQDRKLKLGICTLCSQHPDTGPAAASFFEPLVTHFPELEIEVFDVKDRLKVLASDFSEVKKMANSHFWQEKLSIFGAVFFTGGNQNIALNSVVDTTFHKVLKRRVLSGELALLGTSAGLQIMGHRAITGEFKSSDNFPVTSEEKQCPYIAEDLVELAPGLNLFQGAILDQHFIRRQRQNRLFSISISEKESGIGVDESTCLHISGAPGTTVYPEVWGDSSVFCIDASGLEVTQNDIGKKHYHNLNISLISSGAKLPISLQLGEN